MQVITSVANTQVKALRALYTKKGREDAAAYCVEGVNIVKDIPATQKVLAYYFAESRYETISSVVKDATAKVYVLSDEVFDRVADTVTPQGVVAVLPIPADLPDYRLSRKVLVLDGVADPGNVGTMLRTAIAAGYEDVVVMGGADPYSPKVVRASMGGIYRLRVHRVGEGEWHGDHPLYVLDMDGENVFNVRPTERYALVVGNEAAGVSRRMRDVAYRVISIPMQGGIESLNAAVAAAIGMYQLNVNGGE